VDKARVKQVLTPDSSVLLKKGMVPQHVTKFPAFFGAGKLHFRLYNSPPIDHILCQINLLFSFSLISISILSSLGLPSG